MAARQRVTSGLPEPNQVDDFRRHLIEIPAECARLDKLGHERLLVGDLKGARAALEEADEVQEQRRLIEHRWKPPSIGSVEDPEQPAPPRRRIKRKRR
jgi:hypothetical protein